MQRTSIHNRGYINTPHLNTGGVSGVQYYSYKTDATNDFDKALVKMDNLLSDLFKKYSEKLK